MAVYCCHQELVAFSINNVCKSRASEEEMAFVEFAEFLSSVPIFHELLHEHFVAFAFWLYGGGPFN
jgi:hypothetical protein